MKKRHTSKAPRDPHRQLTAAADYLEHWHLEHTSDMVTRLRGEKADIYITADPEVRELLKKATVHLFPN